MKVGARYYDPFIGRWIQKDPILDGFNWWVYCDNEPVNGVDPSGQDVLSPVGAGTMLIIAGIVLGGIWGAGFAVVGLTIVFYEFSVLIYENFEAAQERKEWEKTEWYQKMGIPPWERRFLE